MLKRIQNNRELTALMAIIALFALLGAMDSQSFSFQTLSMIFGSAQILMLLAMGATVVMLTRNIDVSVGSITGRSAVTLGVLLTGGMSLPLACLLTLGTGLLAGVFNGVLVAWLRIPAIVATLGTLGLYRGLMLLMTGGKWIEGLPAGLKSLSEPVFLSVSSLGWLVIVYLRRCSGCSAAPPLAAVSTLSVTTYRAHGSSAWRSTACAFWRSASTA